MPDKKVVTRFAPSPTGNLHIGGARTALFAWAFARQNGGQLILRLEDTDLARSTPESTRGVVRDLLWLGLKWDQGPAPTADPGSDPYDRATQVGDYGPYFQSQRHEDGIYDTLIQKLLDSGHAYEDGDAVRFRMDKDIAFNDIVYGPIEIKADDLEDFIIRKGDKGGRMPTFHFAVTVDDALMEVTHVIRGQEHLTNTPKHAALCDALGFDRPQWIHLPSIMNADGSKMSKRDKDRHVKAIVNNQVTLAQAGKIDKRWSLMDKVALGIGIEYDRWNTWLAGNIQLSTENLERVLAYYDVPPSSLPEIEVADFQRSGYLQPVLLNYIALLGWNPGDETERFGLDFLVERFDLARIGKKNSQFDRAKLAKFNAEALAEMPPEDFHGLLLDHCKAYHPDFLDKIGESNFGTFAGMYQARSQTLNTPTEMGRFFVCSDDAIEYNAKAVKKNLTKNDGEGLSVLRQAREELAGCDDWTADTLHALIESFTEKHGLKNMGSIAQPLRVAMTGNAVSPEIGPTLELLGKETVLNRIDRCLRECMP